MTESTPVQTVPQSQPPTSLITASTQLSTIYKKAGTQFVTATVGNNTNVIQSKLQHMNNNNGQRIQTLNIQRSTHLPQLSSQNKVQVLSNVVVPKHTNYVLNKGPINNSVQRQIINNSVGMKQIITNAQKINSLNSVNSKQVPSSSHPLNTTTALQQTQKIGNVLNSSNIQTQQVNRSPATQIISTKTPQTHVISRIITPVSKATQQSLKINNSMIVQRAHQTPGGIKTIPPQVNHINMIHKTQNSSTRIANNMVVQQRSGIKTIPPQRPATYVKSIQKAVSSAKQNNYILKNTSVNINRVQQTTSNTVPQNVISAKNKQMLVQSNHQHHRTQIQSPGNNGNIKYHGQQFQVIQTTNSNQPVTTQVIQQPITVVRTVASYEDNNVPSGIANTLFSQSVSLNDSNRKTAGLETLQDNDLSDDEIVGEEVRPDYINPQSIVLFDHNYHRPPPESPTSTLTKPLATPEFLGHPNGVMTGVASQTLQSFMYSTKVDDDAGSTISSDVGREIEPEGEETETAPEGEGDEDSVTRCICDFEHDDGYMICCDKCSVWQHVDCMFNDRQNIQEEYLCERCEPRRVDKQRARAIQLRKREEILNNGNSSDTSSASSADNGINNNVNKKRQHITPLTGRRKSEPTPQRKPSVTSTLRRSRRDSNREQTSLPIKRNTNSKKRQEKKVTSKRKAKSRRSQDITNEDSQELWDRGTSVLQLRQWIEHYEEAVTNHYSPELRARIMKQNGQNIDNRSNNLHTLAQASSNVQKCRVLSQSSFGTKILVTTIHLAPNTPVIELRGKYMLGSPQPIGSQPGTISRHHAQRPGPFLFFYRLPKDGVEVCVDTRTYGNDARFIRRSCKPNAEVKHCIEKGTLHLYIVTVTAIEKNKELTIKHEAHSLVGTNPVVSCACGNPTQCAVAPQLSIPVSPVQISSPTLSRRNNGTANDINEISQRKRRGRRTTSSSEPELPSPTPNVMKSTVTTPLTSPIPPQTTPPMQVHPTSTKRISNHNRIQTKVEELNPISYILEKNNDEDAKDKKKMTREERKMEAIMKAFERLEKQEQRKQESRSRQTRRDHDTVQQTQQNDVTSSEQRTRRKKRKGRSRTTSTNSSSTRRRTRLNSTDSYVTSGDDNSLMSPPLSMDSTTAVITMSESVNQDSIVVSNHCNDHLSTEGHAAGLLLALANGGQHSEEQLKSPEPDNCSSNGSVHSSPRTPLSSNCLLVAAAVEQITPGFKFPKTKKAIMNEWLNKSPEPIQSNSAISPVSLALHMTRPIELSSSLSTPTSSEPCQSLAALVQAANICSVPHSQHPPGGNAKKRWLRQAISEECDSPNSRPESPHSNEMVAPPKKRRMARESLSSEQSFTPPTTPTRSGQNIQPEEYETEHSPHNEEEYDREEKDRIDIGGDDSNSSLINQRMGSNNTSVLQFSSAEGIDHTVEKEIECNNYEQGELSPGIEPDAVLKERVAEMRLEFGENVKCLNITTSSETPIPQLSDSTRSSYGNIMDPRLRCHDNSRLLGTVEKTLQFYEQRLAANKSDVVTPAKRKLSISEYRQRKQQGGTSTTDQQSSNVSVRTADDSSAPESPQVYTRLRSDSTSSTASSLSSDEEHKNLFVNADGQDKDKSTGVAVGFSCAPTLVEQQRENLTARLKREFGLFLSDDDENKRQNTANEGLINQRLPLRSTSFLSGIDDFQKSIRSCPSLLQTSEESQIYDINCKNDTKTIPGNSSDNTYAHTISTESTTQVNSYNGSFSSVNYIPPFNNPVYPNTTQYTGFTPSNTLYITTSNSSQELPMKLSTSECTSTNINFISQLSSCVNSAQNVKNFSKK